MSLDSSVRDESLGSPSSSVIGRFTVDRVRKIDIDFQSKRLDSDGVESTQRSSDRFSKNISGQAELTLSGTFIFSPFLSPQFEHNIYFSFVHYTLFTLVKYRWWFSFSEVKPKEERRKET